MLRDSGLGLSDKCNAARDVDARGVVRDSSLLLRRVSQPSRNRCIALWESTLARARGCNYVGSPFMEGVWHFFYDFQARRFFVSRARKTGKEHRTLFPATSV